MKRILVIDVGGTNLKISTSERRESLKIPSGKAMTAGRMAAEVRKAEQDPDVLQRIANSGAFPAAATPAEFKKFIQSELKAYAEQAKIARIEPE